MKYFSIIWAKTPPPKVWLNSVIFICLKMIWCHVLERYLWSPGCAEAVSRQCCLSCSTVPRNFLLCLTREHAPELSLLCTMCSLLRPGQIAANVTSFRAILLLQKQCEIVLKNYYVKPAAVYSTEQTTWVFLLVTSSVPAVRVGLLPRGCCAFANQYKFYSNFNVINGINGWIELQTSSSWTPRLFNARVWDIQTVSITIKHLSSLSWLLQVPVLRWKDDPLEASTAVKTRLDNKLWWTFQGLKLSERSLSSIITPQLLHGGLSLGLFQGWGDGL